MHFRKTNIIFILFDLLFIKNAANVTKKLLRPVHLFNAKQSRGAPFGAPLLKK